MLTMYKRLRALLIIALVVSVGAAAVVRFQMTARSLRGALTGSSTVQETSTVDRGDIVLTVSASGSIQANQNVSLAFPVNTKVTAINVQEGDHVLKGQTIATVNSQAYTDAMLLA